MSRRLYRLILVPLWFFSVVSFGESGRTGRQSDHRPGDSLSYSIASAKRITRHYNNVTLSEVLLQLSREQTDYTISFIYNELEKFRITTTIKNQPLPDAIQQIIGFYPVRMSMKPGGQEIFVECTSKTNCHLTGSVIDEQGQPIAYANIAILNPTDSTLIGSGISNEGGYFAIPYEGERSLVRISHVGYRTVWRHCDKGDAGTVRMLLETQRLKGVTVEGQVPILRHGAGMIVFDTRHAVGAVNATDLLRFTPGVMIENDEVSLFGTNGVTFHINGREQRLDTREMLQMLRSYSASDVEKIEIVQNPGSSHSAEGNAGVINLILKKNDHDYIGGSAAYARTQYEGSRRVGDKTSGTSGNEANASIVYSRGKIATSLNIAGIWDNTRYLDSNDIGIGDDLRHHTDNGHVSNESHSLRWQADYRVSDKLNLGAYAMFADGERHLTVDGFYDFLPKKPYSRSSTETQTQRQENTKTWAANVNAAQLLGHGGTKIDCNLDYCHMTMGDACHSISNMTSIMGSLNEIHQSDTTDNSYQNHIALTVDNYSAKVDVSHACFRIGTQYAYTRSHRDLDYSGVGSYNHVSSTYDEQIWAGYLEYCMRPGKAWSISLGGRYEHTWTNRSNRPIDYGKHVGYGKLFPSLDIGYRPNQSHTFTGSLNNRITRPNIVNINPDMVWKDIHHMSIGNLYLKPSYLHKATTSYTYKNILGLDLYYAWQLDRVDAVYLVNLQKIDNSWNNTTDEHILGINTFCHFDKLRWMTATLVQGVRYSKTVKQQGETVLGIVKQYRIPEVESVSYTGMLQATFFLDCDRKWTASLNATYNSPEKDVSKNLDARYTVDAGMQYRFWRDRLTIGLTCRNLLASHIKGTEHLGTTEMDFDNKLNYRQFRLSLTYNWGARLRHNQRRYESDEIQQRIINDF